MTFDDDFIQLRTESGPRRLRCKLNGIEWPPPERLDLHGFTWERLRMSEITDEERAAMTHVCRGAEYSQSSTEANTTSPSEAMGAPRV